MMFLFVLWMTESETFKAVFCLSGLEACQGPEIRGVKLMVVQGPHAAQFDLKWASRVKSVHNNLSITTATYILFVFVP